MKKTSLDRYGHTYPSIPKFVQNPPEEPHGLSYVFSGVGISLLCKGRVI